MVQEVSSNYLSQTFSSPNVSEDTNVMLLPKRELFFWTHPVQRAIAKYKHHQSILLIQSRISKRYKFFFSEVSKTDVEKELKTSTQEKVLPITISLQEYWKKVKVSSNFLQKLVSGAIINGKFPKNLKLADVFQVFKWKTLMIKQVMDQLMFYQQFWKSLKSL